MVLLVLYVFIPLFWCQMISFWPVPITILFVYGRAECASVSLKCTKVKLLILNKFDIYLLYMTEELISIVDYILCWEDQGSSYMHHIVQVNQLDR